MQPVCSRLIQDKIKSFLINCGIFSCRTRATSMTCNFLLASVPPCLSPKLMSQGQRLKDYLWKPKSYLPDMMFEHEWLILLPWIDLYQQLWLHSLIWGEYHKPRQIVSTVTCWDSMTWSVGLVTVRPKSVTTDQESGAVYLGTYPQATYDWGICLILYISVTSIGTSLNYKMT